MFKKSILVLLGILLASKIVSADINDGLLAYWNFDDCSATDASGNGHDGNISGSVECVDGISGTKGMNFHVDNDHISAVADASFSSKQITLSAWINPTGGGTWNPRVVAVGPSKSSDQFYSIILQGTKTKRHVWLFSDGNSRGVLLSAKYISNNSGWHHVAGTIDGSTARLYVDGRLDSVTKKYPSLKSFNSGLIQIGYSDRLTDQFVGGIDEVRIYNRALTAGEIRSLNYQGHPPTIKGSVGWGTAHTVTCQNITKNIEVTIPSTELLGWDCEKAGLPVQSGDAVEVRIKGTKY